MTIEQKQQIANQLEEYMQEHNLSQADIAKGAGVNAVYIINIRNGQFKIKSGDKSIDIQPKYFKRLADYIGANAESEFWQNQATHQLKVMVAALNESKENNQTCLIIGETGSGKTHILEAYKKKHPKEVFSIKVSQTDRIKDLIDKTLAVLKIEHRYTSTASKMKAICDKLKSISEEGNDPVLAFDEAEYMKQPALCAMKEFYDNLNGIAAIVMIGTPQLTKELERLRKKDKQGIPQLYRRIKYNIVQLPAIDNTYTEFLEDIEDKELKRWLQRNCTNYGELHDVVVRAKKHAKAINAPLTMDLVRTILRQ